MHPILERLERALRDAEPARERGDRALLHVGEDVVDVCEPQELEHRDPSRDRACEVAAQRLERGVIDRGEELADLDTERKREALDEAHLGVAQLSVGKRDRDQEVKERTPLLRGQPIVEHRGLSDSIDPAMEVTRFERVIARIDAANDADPRGHERSYGERMSAALARLAPEASEALRIAVRAQHLERWTIARERFSRDRAGYLRWRSELARFHARRAGELMREVGYDDAAIARVGDLVQKRRLRADEEAQILEDCACLVFLEFELERFAAREPEEKVIEILGKTWAKMAERGREAARALLPALPPRSRALIERALGALSRDGTR